MEEQQNKNFDEDKLILPVFNYGDYVEVKQFFLDKEKKKKKSYTFTGYVVKITKGPHKKNGTFTLIRGFRDIWIEKTFFVTAPSTSQEINVLKKSTSKKINKRFIHSFKKRYKSS